MSDKFDSYLDNMIKGIENNIEKDRAIYSPNEYYNLVDNFGVSEKISGIIDRHISKTINKTELYTQFDTKIGIICDEFMYYSLENAANLEYIKYDGSGEIKKEIDILLVVTTWKGIDNSWQYLANPEGQKRNYLIELIKKYNIEGIPTVFYSKEDPVNYDKFLSLAKVCQYIFTSAEEMIPIYKNDTGINSVDYLEFGINPTYHNPIGKNLEDEELSREVIFAGSWMTKYPTRNEEAKMLFDGVRKTNFNLNIIDRNYERRLQSYQFPPRYLDYISRTVNHKNLMKLHQATSFGLNLNSVKYSNTMFANRIYELQAMGNIVLSNYSMGVNNKFPNVFLINDTEDIKQILRTMTREEQKGVIANNIQNVMLSHTSYHRIDKIQKAVGIKSEIKTPKILVIGESQKSIGSFKRQTLKTIEFVEKSKLENSIYEEYDYITYFADEVEYEEYYLNNLLSGFAYTDADVVMMDADKYEFSNKKQYDKYFSMNKLESHNKTMENLKIFNIPRTEIFYKKVKPESKKLLSVIIPIHNNGIYLENKCFRSLERSSIFHLMDIILIDDGSNDEETLKIINRIIRRYPDIKYFRFEKGSGSASRPRNKGIEMVKTDYITFLDPDNEAVGDGYAHLLESMLENKSIDISLGNVIKEDHTKRTILRYTYYMNKYNESLLVEDTKAFLMKAGLRAHSIQALIVKSSIVKNHDLKMIEGAAGQDTMFFQELVLHSKSILGLETNIHTYYAAVDGSVTNSIKKNFFDKYYKLEIERIPFLKKHGLYDVYINERFPFYFKNWYFNRFERVTEDDKEEARIVLRDIFNMYKDDYKFNDSQLNFELEKFLGVKVYLGNNKGD